MSDSYSIIDVEVMYMPVSRNLSHSFKVGHSVFENGHTHNLTTHFPREVLLFVPVFSLSEAICVYPPAHDQTFHWSGYCEENC